MGASGGREGFFVDVLHPGLENPLVAGPEDVGFLLGEEIMVRAAEHLLPGLADGAATGIVQHHKPVPAVLYENGIADEVENILEDVPGQYHCGLLGLVTTPTRVHRLRAIRTAIAILLCGGVSRAGFPASNPGTLSCSRAVLLMSGVPWGMGGRASHPPPPGVSIIYSSPPVAAARKLRSRDSLGRRSP